MKKSIRSALILFFVIHSAGATDPVVNLTDYTGPLLSPYGHGTSANAVLNGVDWRNTAIRGPARRVTFLQDLPIDYGQLDRSLNYGEYNYSGTLVSDGKNPMQEPSCTVDFSEAYARGKKKGWTLFPSKEKLTGYEANSEYTLKSVRVATYSGDMIGENHDRMVVSLYYASSAATPQGLIIECVAHNRLNPNQAFPAEKARSMIFNLPLEEIEKTLLRNGQPLLDFTVQKH
jgi:hypothetical protein